MDSTRSSVTMMGPVVVGTDGSDHAMRAVRWAVGEAAARGRPLRIVYATGTDHGRPYLSREDGRQIYGFAEGVLDEAVALARRLDPAVPVTTTVCENEPAACLLGEAGSDATIVVGSRGRGGFASLLVGSDSLRVAARSLVPVVVVPSDGGREPAGVVLAAARDERDEEALRVAAALAAREGASLRVFSAWVFLENVGSMATMFDGVDRLASDQATATARLVAPVREEFPELTVSEHVVRAGSVSEVLVAATAGADVIVIGSRRRSHSIGSPLGHVTHAVLHHAHCPVVLVPHP
ncbi:MULTISPECIES: universal stress protein [unclassified Streptomyces]|uniref:universal stress protein n=1 Tax=unclassified Streptomyces TaxID=2593676 RepID=UPI002E772466|nr:universal stress protein [Streptomyces sp. JV184]MEE1742901.1 universal stress protein [Streptomyces sp. JV184]